MLRSPGLVWGLLTLAWVAGPQIRAQDPSSEITELKVIAEGDDGKAVQGIVGVDIHIKSPGSPKISLSGEPLDKKGYSYVINLKKGVKSALLPLKIRPGDTWCLYFEAYPKNDRGKTDNSSYTSAVYQNFQIRSGESNRQVHVTFQAVGDNKCAYITGQALKNGSPWAHKYVRLWGGPSGTDTGYDASFSTDENGCFKSNPLKTFYIDSEGTRVPFVKYGMQIQNTAKNFVVGSFKLQAGQTLDLGTIHITAP